MLRDYNFISASQYNRACYLSQINKIFLSSPYYTVITALDYHQCLCLVCSDFPRTLVSEAAKLVPKVSTENPTENPEFVSSLAADAIMFDKFEIGELKDAVELFLYYAEAMDKVKALFSELANENFEYDAQIMISLLYTGLSTSINRNKMVVYPPFECLVEALLSKAQRKLQLDVNEFYILEEIGSLIHGSGTISYREFCYVSFT